MPNDDDQSTDSTDDRWFRYKTAERAAGREPMSWGDWLSKGQPVPEGA